MENYMSYLIFILIAFMAMAGPAVLCALRPDVCELIHAMACVVDPTPLCITA